MKKAVIVGYGNIGKYSKEALEEAPDFEITGIISRNPSVDLIDNIPVRKSVLELDTLPDVAILAVPSRDVLEHSKIYLDLGINTVDSYDEHSHILELKNALNTYAKNKNAVSVISAGWDPGIDSVVRTMLEAVAPKGTTYTNFGPGMSMGHTVAVKKIDGVKNALSVTIPVGSGKHDRMVYVEIEDTANLGEVEKNIKNDPYFIHDNTTVVRVKNVNDYIDVGHGVHLIRKGVSGKTHNQIFEYKMSINNPALTAEALVCAARASFRQESGCYTMIEIPVIDYMYGSRDEIISKLV